MQTSTSEFINWGVFARAVADHLKESLSGIATAKRVFNLDEAAEYCGLSRESFKKKVVRDRLRKVRVDKCWRFDKADLDEWIDSHKRSDHPGESGVSKRRVKPTKSHGSVFSHPRSPYWQLSYWNGKSQVRESARTTDYAEAVKLLQRKLTENAGGKWACPERVYVSALLQLVVDDYRRNDQADLHETEQRVNRLLKPAFGHLRITEFTTKALNDYIRQRQQLGRKNGTINRELAHLRRAFRLGFGHDPQLVYRLPIIKALREDNVRDGFLEPEHYRLILEALTLEIKPIFVVAYHLGMRTGELLALKRSWVDLREGLIYVNGRVTKNREPKTAPIYGDMGP